MAAMDVVATRLEVSVLAQIITLFVCAEASTVRWLVARGAPWFRLRSDATTKAPRRVVAEENVSMSGGGDEGEMEKG